MTAAPASNPPFGTRPGAAPRRIVVMGVSGCGKSTVGAALAQALAWPYVEGDAFHPPENIARMAAGQALTDADRSGWLVRLADELRTAATAGTGLVLSCSALKRSYRDLLRSGEAPANRTSLCFVHLQGTRAVLAERVARRQHEYMPASLLDSQLATLEPPGADECALTVDVAQAPADIVLAVRQWLDRLPPPASTGASPLPT